MSARSDRRKVTDQVGPTSSAVFRPRRAFGHEIALRRRAGTSTLWLPNAALRRRDVIQEPPPPPRDASAIQSRTRVFDVASKRLLPAAWSGRSASASSPVLPTTTLRR